MSRLRTYAAMKRSRAPRVKRSKSDPLRGVWTSGLRVAQRMLIEAWTASDPVYVVVDARAKGYCEVILDGARCRKRAVDHHHVSKPRRSFHDPDHVMAICRSHHDRVDFPYQRGRLLTLPLGDGKFQCRIAYAADKFTYRGGQR
jgi:hypothetical protein